MDQGILGPSRHEPQGLKTLGASKKKPYLDELCDIAAQSPELIEELAHAPDRMAVIVAGAAIDDLLFEVLRANMRNDVKADKLLNQSIRNWSSRTEACYLLGLISEDEKHDSDLIRQMRNDCAHLRQSIDLENPQLKMHCGKLRLAERFWSSCRSDPEDTKCLFVSGFLLLASALMHRATSTSHPIVPDEVPPSARIAYGGALNRDK